jgi:FkbH-like protein
MSTLYRDLEWLPRMPEDFRKRCAAIRESNEKVGATLQALATHALDENALARIYDILKSARAAGRDLSELTPFRLGIVGNGTIKHYVPSLVGSAVRHGIALECVVADYGQMAQEAIDPSSSLNRAGLDAILIALDFRGLPSRGEGGNAEDFVADSLGLIDTLRAGFRANAKIPCIVQTIACPPEFLFGSLEGGLPDTLRWKLGEINRRIFEALVDSEDVVLDIAALAETVGTGEWFSATQWNLGKYSFDAAYLPLYADHIGRLIASMRGKARKCLVLDLDNTLWGGVIGDDGLDGIVLGQGNATGEAHLELQRTALALRSRGIILAVSSKNEDATARSPFREHAEMLLKEDHIAVFQANWSDKATNLAAIARELAIGVDSLVFVDDNPVERELVRQSLPAVAVPEMPTNPALYARTLLAAGYFEAVAFSAEDRARAGYYQQNARRAQLREQIADIETYLTSLRMTIQFRPFDEVGRPRIAQLINKSNQFNLTTKRYSEADVAAIAADPSCFTLQVRLADAFDDNGMISVIICRPESADSWAIDTWLMSCRVLGRRVEHMVLREILQQARSRGISRVIGTYLPTPKNAMVEGHYEKLGFTLIERREDGSSVWEIDSSTEIPSAPMTVDRGEPTTMSP